MIGNMDNLISKGEIWPKVSQVLQQQNALVDALELRCDLHSVITQVSCKEDFKNTPEGGCMRQCGSLMPCGHTCAQLCHAVDRTHMNFKCYEPCTRPVCVKNHICPDKCYLECKPCMVPTVVKLPCGHQTQIPCHVEPNEHMCLEVVSCTLVPCNHKKDVPCHLSKKPDQIKCVEPCTFRLPCGHSCEKYCHLLDDPDHEMYKCLKPCGHFNVGCTTKEHICRKACHQDCADCVVMVLKTLSCGHEWTMKCHEEPSRKLCGNKCISTNECGHKCLKKCREDCNPCLQQVKKTVPRCGHSVMMPCGVDPIFFERCTEKCDRKLPCGHSCNKLCYQECLSNCQELVPFPKRTGCGHRILVPCYQKDSLGANSDELLQLCTQSCNFRLQPCMHACKGTCGSCWQGRLHKPCGEPCGRGLVCGHSCKAPCAATCPPCSARCSEKCIHSRCPNKCGQPCAPCKELCPRKCPHSACNKECGQKCNVEACQKPCRKTLKHCKHKCIGLCGDLCICAECNDGIRELFFGTEDDENVSFVKLPDCNHIFESCGLLQWLLQNSETQDQGKLLIKEKVCPRCSTPIRTCLRYKEIVMKHANDVQEVKRKVFGKIIDITVTARKALDVLPPSSAFPQEMAACTVLRSTLFEKMWKMDNNKLKRKMWFRPQLSLGEVKNLYEYSKILSTLANISQKGLGLSNPRTASGTKEQKLTVAKPKYKLNDKCQAEIKSYVTKFANNLQSRSLIRLSKQEAGDIAGELRRLDVILQLCYIESSPNFSAMSAMSKEMYHVISSRVRGFHQYLDSEYSTDSNHLKTIADKLQAVISKEEIKSVVAAMGMTKGHWFKCPNGHVYAIGNCGGATMESKCNECGTIIGGTQHRLRADNRFAPEIDNATDPAWPGTAMALY